MNHRTQQTASEWVVFVHGLASSKLLMRPLAARVQSAGFRTHCWGYFTFGGKVDHIATRLATALNRVASKQNVSKLHVVAHSMGSIVTRRMLLDEVRFPLGRVVMLAPPNQGSHVATRLSKHLSPICPALIKLADSPDSYVRNLGVPKDYEIGIIAAGGDLVVTPASTRLGVELDFAIVPGMHSGILFRQETAGLITSFLREGHFGGLPQPT